MTATATEPTTVMSTRVPREMKAELDRLAKATGRDRNTLVQEALRRFIAVERWQLADVEAGPREADAGDFATDEEVDAVFNKYAAYRDQPDEARVG